jgi:hypothetical protein
LSGRINNYIEKNAYVLFSREDILEVARTDSIFTQNDEVIYAYSVWLPKAKTKQNKKTGHAKGRSHTRWVG